MSYDVDLLVRTSRAVGGVHRTVGELAVPVAVVDGEVPMSEVEVLFRSPHLPCLAVLTADGPQVGMVSRARFADAQTGRLGFGRAVLSRRPVREVADWSPLVVDEGTGVVEAATRAMERSGETRYDDVLVRAAAWGAVATADLVRSLVASLSERSLHDPLTRLPGRELVLHTLRTWEPMLRGTGRRLLVLRADVAGFARVNVERGAAAGDGVLRELAGRLAAGLPPGSLVGRTGSDEFTAVVLLPPAPDGQAEAQVDAALATADDAVTPRVAGEPRVRLSAAISAPGSADVVGLLELVGARMLARKEAEVVTVVA